jgi:hypothetical protein
LRICLTIYICRHYMYIIESSSAHHWLNIELLFIHRWLNIDTSFAHHCFNIEAMLKVWSLCWPLLCQQGYIVVVLIVDNCINIYTNCVNIGSTLGQHWRNIDTTLCQHQYKIGKICNIESTIQHIIFLLTSSLCQANAMESKYKSIYKSKLKNRQMKL